MQAQPSCRPFCPTSNCAPALTPRQPATALLPGMRSCAPVSLPPSWQPCFRAAQQLPCPLAYQQRFLSLPRATFFHHYSPLVPDMRPLYPWPLLFPMTFRGPPDCVCLQS